MTSQQASAIIGISDSNIRRHCRRGELKAVKHGRGWWIEPRDLEQFAAQERRPGRKAKGQS